MSKTSHSGTGNVRIDWRYAALAVACAFTILALGQRPAADIPRFGILPPHFDKVMHFAMYATFAALVWRVWVPRSARRAAPLGRAAVLAIGLSALLGLTDEVAQHLANRGRSADPIDWIADVVGAVFAVLFGVWLRGNARRAR